MIPLKFIVTVFKKQLINDEEKKIHSIFRSLSLSLLSTYLKNENNDEQLELSLANLSYFNVNPFVE